MEDHDTCICIFGELIGQDRRYTLKNQGDVNIAFLYEQRDVGRKKASTMSANFFISSVKF